MSEENNENEIKAPDFSGEEMKLPENVKIGPEVEKTSSNLINGPLLLTLMVLLILILGGMAYWFNTLNTPTPTPAPVVERPTPEENNEPESTTSEAQVETMQTVGTSDEISAIEADIESSDLDSFDAELNAIDAEMEAALQE